MSEEQTPVGIRLNNPGCLRRAVSPDSRSVIVDGYAQFISWHEGCENLAWIIWNYYHHLGLVTPRAFLSRYAPATENDTLGYINFVCDWLGIDRRQDGIADMHCNRIGGVVSLMQALSTRECGWKSTQKIPHEMWISTDDAMHAIAVVGKWT